MSSLNSGLSTHGSFTRSALRKICLNSKAFVDKVWIRTTNSWALYSSLPYVAAVSICSRSLVVVESNELPRFEIWHGSDEVDKWGDGLVGTGGLQQRRLPEAVPRSASIQSLLTRRPPYLVRRTVSTHQSYLDPFKRKIVKDRTQWGAASMWLHHV